MPSFVFLATFQLYMASWVTFNFQFDYSERVLTMMMVLTKEETSFGFYFNHYQILAEIMLERGLSGAMVIKSSCMK